jgi:hypothetical protein
MPNQRMSDQRMSDQRMSDQRMSDQRMSDQRMSDQRMSDQRMSDQRMSDQRMSDQRMSNQHGGHLYMQTNELRNCIAHYHRSANGKLHEVERVLTGGTGSGGFKPISGQESAPNDFEGAGSVILTPDRRFLFTTNAGDNSVSSFRVGEDGSLTQVDRKPTGNAAPEPEFRPGVPSKSGTCKSLCYSPSTGMLYVLHSFGPDHLRLMSVDGEGKLTPRPEKYSVNTKDATDRVATMVMLSPNGKFLFVGTTFDQRASANPDGSPILWVPGPDGKPASIASNWYADGLIIFPVGENGTLGPASFHDGGGLSPWNIAFLHSQPDTFILGYAVSDGCAVGSIDEEGRIGLSPVVKVDTSPGLPSELCWLAISPDDKMVYATNFGYGYLSSYRINSNGTELAIAKDPACPPVRGDGTFRGLDGVVTSGPSDSWITPDGDYLYQIYGNAAKLVGYATQPDGSLNEITSIKIPYNSPQGLAGF